MNFSAHTLWYAKPARDWNEALPIGNGRIGAMVFGGVASERLCLNEDTLWSGYPNYYVTPGAPEMLTKARALTRERKYEEATRLMSEEFSNQPTQKYLPLGDLELTFDHTDFSDYRRTLDLSTAVHTTEYVSGGVTYHRTACVSHPDQVLAMHITADVPGKVNFTARLTSQLRLGILAAQKDFIVFEGQCPSATVARRASYMDIWYDYHSEPEKQGILFGCMLRIIPEGGEVIAEEGALRVRGANAATIYFTVRTSFSAWNKHPVLEAVPYREPAVADMEKAVARGFYPILASHAADHGAFYARTALDLGGGEEGLLPTDERLVRHKNGGEDLALYALLFHYGRYLTIAGSRPGTQATNLQGIWNHHLHAPWCANYTININTEMNYWPTLMTNLTECYEPLLSLISELAESGSRTARDYYDARGFCSHHNTDLWRLSTPVGHGRPACAVFAYWPMSSGWFMRHICEYYEYTRDEKWLREVGYPLIRGCTQFFADVLTEDTEGWLSFSPSTSPENRFVDPITGAHSDVSETTAMTDAIIRDVFAMFVRFAAQLGLDADFAAQIEAMRPRLRPYKLREDGSIMEWNEELAECEVTHRHISHLYGMHPAHEITPDGTPELAAAVRKTLENRGDDGTGWSLGWKINQFARLHDGDHALKLIDMQLRPAAVGFETVMHGGGGSYPNLLDAHPPFQIDGNFGVCSGIAEMLLQGDAENPLILPALPAAWKSGSVRGLRIRGGKTVSIVWQDGKAASVTID
ncbi:MAG: glycoside hydrolase family 95 protein [Ruminococcaceae bacterium]|nr:glycoside hydrolase family 95 protein [Oscillospiraceae bacterium]